MKNRDILNQVLRLLLGTAVCTGLMLAVYALLDKLTAAVMLGALAGLILSVGNFFFLAISVSRAADRATETGDAAKAKREIRSAFSARLLVLFLLYFLILKTGRLDAVAALLPMLFAQLSLRVIEFFRKDGDT